MTTTLNFKNLIDLPEWRPCAVGPSTSIVGECMAFDLRSNNYRDPYLYHQASTTTIECYNQLNDEWYIRKAFTAVGVTPAAGSGVIFVPSHGPSGTVGATPSTANITLAALPNSATVGINQLANRGDGTGYRIRIIDKAGGATGKLEERTIISNTAGATPIVYFDTPLTFTPAAGATYEILSGRVYVLSSGTTAAGYWKAYDVATNTMSGNLSTTNLAATIALDFQCVALDEAYTPYNRNPGEGMIDGGSVVYDVTRKCIQATAANATTITGSDMPALLATNEYRNFQIRIVEDTTAPTAVGQRARISSHTSGATGIFTVPAWPTATPSADAKFVVEQNNDLLLWTNGALVTYSYKAGAWESGANWSTAAAAGGAGQYANPPAAMGAGAMVEGCWPIVVDASRLARHSHIIWFRGAATITAYYLDIAAAATGTWSAALDYGGLSSTTFTTGTSAALDPTTNQGRYLYICVNGTQRFARFDLLNRALEPWAYLRYAPGTAVVGGKLATATFIDGETKLSFLYVIQTTSANMFNIALQR